MIRHLLNLKNFMTTPERTLLLLEDTSLTRIRSGLCPQTVQASQLEPQETQLVLDLESIEYTFDTLPSIALLDRLLLRKKRFQRTTEGALLKGLIPYSTHASGIVKIPSSPTLEKVFSNLKGLPIQKITTAPLEAFHSLDSTDGWQLVIYERQDHKLRHCLFQDEKLIFTRVIQSNQTPEKDILSTLTYCDRFGLDLQSLTLVQLGALTHPLPDSVQSRKVQKCHPHKSLGEILLERKGSPRSLSLTPNPFRTAFLKFKAPDWFTLFSKGYGIVGSALSLVLCLWAALQSQTLETLEQDLIATAAQLSYFEKTHKGVVQKVAFVKIYEETMLGQEDPLHVLKAIAAEKPPSLIIRKILWQREHGGDTSLNLETENHEATLTRKETRKAHKRFYKSLNRAFSGKVVEATSPSTEKQEELLIAESTHGTQAHHTYRKQYSIRGMRA